MKYEFKWYIVDATWIQPSYKFFIIGPCAHAAKKGKHFALVPILTMHADFNIYIYFYTHFFPCNVYVVIAHICFITTFFSYFSYCCSLFDEFNFERCFFNFSHVEDPLSLSGMKFIYDRSMKTESAA